MSNINRNRSFIGGGKIWIREIGSTVTPQFVQFGNADSFSFAISEDKKSQRNFQLTGGGNIASQSAITDVTATINGLSFQPRTLAVALRSVVNIVPSEVVVDEVKKVFAESITRLDALPDQTIEVVVKSSDGVTTYVKGTDYNVEYGCITIPEGSTITASDTTNVGVDVKVSYTSKEVFNIQGITKSAVEYELLFNGFNDGDNGKAVTVECHKIKFSPTQALELIGEDFGSLPVSFEVLADDTITDSAESQYFTVDMES